MKPIRRAARTEILEFAFFGLFFLSFLQLLSEFISAIYAIGLLELSLTAEVLSVLLLLSPLILLARKRPPNRMLLILIGEAALICRAILPLLSTRGVMLAAGVGTGLSMIFLPAILSAARGASRPRLSRTLGLGLALSVASSILLRALGSGLDVSLEPPLSILGLLLAAAAAAALPVISRLWISPAGDRPQAQSHTARSGPWFALAPAGVGTMSIFGSLYFVFAAPNVVARWTATSYAGVVTLLLLGLLFLAIAFVPNRPLIAGFSRAAVLIWAGMFALAMVVTIAGNQVAFPGHPAAYPFFPPPVSGVLRIPLVLMLMLAPVLFISFMLFLRSILRLSPSARQLGVGFGVGGGFLLALIFAHIFTSVYDYIPIVGPFFRDRFWLVHLLLMVGVVLPLTSLKEADLRAPRISVEAETRNVFLISVVALAAASIGAISLREPAPLTEPAPQSLRLVTYNIQQGYDAAGQRNFNGQLALLRRLDPDLIGLQESDTNRISVGNADVVRYFADELGMYSYYGPKTVNGTFGIALLSKLPLQDARTFYMYSEGEQTASIEAHVQVAAGDLQILVTHLGNGGPLIQQQAVLSRIDPQTRIVLMGDFNFRPGTEQYKLTTTEVLDAWRLKWPRGMDDQNFQPDERIDHIFVSSGTVVDEIRFSTEPQSDHPALFAELHW
jgi:endonuclease/exonuclease/phosphatase family metal-dependent hydrolase